MAILWEPSKFSSFGLERKLLLTCFNLFFLFGPSLKSKKFWTKNKHPIKKGAYSKYLSSVMHRCKTLSEVNVWRKNLQNTSSVEGCVFIFLVQPRTSPSTQHHWSRRSSIKTVAVAKAIKLKHISKYNFYWTTGWKWKHRGRLDKSIHYRIYVRK